MLSCATFKHSPSRRSGSALVSEKASRRISTLQTQSVRATCRYENVFARWRTKLANASRLAHSGPARLIGAALLDGERITAGRIGMRPHLEVVDHSLYYAQSVLQAFARIVDVRSEIIRTHVRAKRGQSGDQGF
jgi:hypothetical protein